MARRIEVHRPDRWDNPFSTTMTGAEVQRILAAAPIDRIDPTKFPATASLTDIVRNDMRLQHYAPGDIVVREEDYGNSAFVVLSGVVRVILSPKLPARALGREVARKRSLISVLSQLWRNDPEPETRDLSGFDENRTVLLRTGADESVRLALSDPGTVTKNSRTALIGQGEMFGEIGALARTPRTATIYVDQEAELIEIRWQGLRDIRRRDPFMRDHIDRLYRERSLAAQLRDMALLADVSPEAIGRIADATLFETYGDAELFATGTDAEASDDPAERLGGEPEIASEDHQADALIIVRAGFARLTERVDHGHRTVGYLGPGGIFGLQEIVHTQRTQQGIGYQRSLRAIGNIDILRIPADVVVDNVLPSIADDDLPPPVEARGRARSAWRRVRREDEIEPRLLEFLVDNRTINGTATMFIDTERCTRCDECVRACAATHNGNPRFVRNGIHHDRWMIAHACMHCVDPLCLIGCPTGAIHRNAESGTVVINDVTCIGCGTCAESCPYDNISMVDIRDQSGAYILDERTNQPIEKATKCDLCADQIGGPACQRACPNDALKRIDMRDLVSLASWVAR